MDWDDLKVLLALSRKGSARGAAQELTVSNSTIGRRLAIFCEEYPGIELEMSASFETLDLSRREADIAIRVMPAGVKPADYLIGRYLAPMTASAYVHRDLLNPDRPQDVSHLTWIGKNPGDQKEEWLAKVDWPELPARHAVVDYSLVVEAVRAKMGLAFMPCFAVHDIPEVVRVPGATIAHHSDMWVLTHKDLRLSARMRILREIIAEEFAKIADRLDSRPG